MRKASSRAAKKRPPKELYGGGDVINKLDRSKVLFLLVFAAPTIILYFIFCVYPIFSSIYTSFFSWSGYSEDMRFIGLGNYLEIIRDRGFLTAVRNDFIIVLGKEIFILVLSVLFAVSLTRLRFKKAEVGIYRFIFYFPNVLSVVIIATVWAFVFDPINGLLNALLEMIGLGGAIPPEGWLVKYPLPSIITVASWCGIGLFMIVMIAAINNVSAELYEAAQIDGAGEWRQLITITMPAVWHQIKFAIITILYSSLGNNFTLVRRMFGSAVNDSSSVMGLYVYQQGFDSLTPRVGYANAAGVIMLVITATVSLLANHFLTRKED